MATCDDVDFLGAFRLLAVVTTRTFCCPKLMITVADMYGMQCGVDCSAGRFGAM